jgi:hypothetical protein
MGFLDRAKKLAEQALEKANETIADVRPSTPGGPSPAGPAPAAPAGSKPPGELGTPYRPGMLGRAGWRERGLVDPAALLPMWDRHRAGIDHSTKSEILDAPYGMGRRWTSNGRSAGLFYRLYPEQESWTETASADGRMLTFVDGAIDGERVRTVLETSGLDDESRATLASVVAQQLARQ